MWKNKGLSLQDIRYLNDDKTQSTDIFPVERRVLKDDFDTPTDFEEWEKTRHVKSIKEREKMDFSLQNLSPNVNVNLKEYLPFDKDSNSEYTYKIRKDLLNADFMTMFNYITLKIKSDPAFHNVFFPGEFKFDENTNKLEFNGNNKGLNAALNNKDIEIILIPLTFSHHMNLIFIKKTTVTNYLEIERFEPHGFDKNQLYKRYKNKAASLDPSDHNIQIQCCGTCARSTGQNHGSDCQKILCTSALDSNCCKFCNVYIKKDYGKLVKKFIVEDDPYTSSYIDTLVNNFFKQTKMKFKYIPAIELCPRYGPQSNFFDTGFCQSWIWFYAELRIKNRNSSSEEVLNSILNGSTSQQLHVIIQTYAFNAICTVKKIIFPEILRTLRSLESGMQFIPLDLAEELFQRIKDLSEWYGSNFIGDIFYDLYDIQNAIIKP